ncbi:Uncharacterised protein [Klebsiella pneumoniae]|nr:Uncharacterised protein [Klebsiella pneumoniae]
MFTGTMTDAYSLKPSVKKSAVTMFTRFDTMSGRLEVSAIKPAAITNASVEPGVNPSASSMAITIGVRISAAPSLANSAATAAPSRTIYVNSSRPLPPPQRETCSAAHSKKPDSSSSRLIISPMCTTPVSSASAAPMTALQPMLSPFGCQMTSTSVRMKIAPARNIPAPIEYKCLLNRTDKFSMRNIFDNPDIYR